MAISPVRLLEQVRGTAPFLFEGDPPEEPSRRFLRALRNYDGEALPATGYFELCLAAHWATAGAFVPTDVDNAIRWKLWQAVSPELTLRQAELALEALSWDYSGVTRRVIGSPRGLLSTHEGTWFSVAVGAYAAARQALPALAGRVLDAMAAEAARQRDIFAALVEAGDGVRVLKAAALIAHNFGDLDRVADQWELGESDPVKRSLCDAAKPGSPIFAGLLGRAGELNQRYLAADNHRHYPLRAARALRRSADLLIPVGPFFDDWGKTVARHPALSREDVASVARALIDGWVRLHAPAGYARALAGILEVFPGGRNGLARLLPGADRRMIESGTLKTAIDVPQERFEALWANLVRKV